MSELQAWVEKLSHLKPEEIRKLMQDEGIQGDRCDAGKCPVARFLQRQCGIHVDVGAHFVNDLQSPSSIKTFISEFDQSWYPELIRRRDISAG